MNEGHADHTFAPLPEDTLHERLTDAGFNDVNITFRNYEVRFAANKPHTARRKCPLILQAMLP